MSYAMRAWCLTEEGQHGQVEDSIGKEPVSKGTLLILSFVDSLWVNLHSQGHWSEKVQESDKKFADWPCWAIWGGVYENLNKNMRSAHS